MKRMVEMGANCVRQLDEFQCGLMQELVDMEEDFSSLFKIKFATGIGRTSHRVAGTVETLLEQGNPFPLIHQGNPMKRMVEMGASLGSVARAITRVKKYVASDTTATLTEDISVS